ncbi:hypothetical protein Salat_1616700 [Sesamum alatum]|uniref:Uncharacterized protein n=1 Tax=Sesamum alatum TaxID=300844 RepID=A0AAE2CJA0_9LAMI|nr:hypothetical protein Salat_1616700 [Sesamum alatum]
MAWRGSLSRSLMSTARASAFRSSPSLSAPRRLRPPPLSAPRLQQRRLSFSNPRSEILNLMLPVDNGGARMRSVTHADVGRSTADFSPGRQRAGVLVEWKRWVMSAALPNDQRQSPDTALYLTILLDSAELMLKDLVLGH